MWYDKSQILSYNKIFNFVIGNRGGGKTYEGKKWAINDFKKNGKHFVWVRRYKEELSGKKIRKFFDDIRHEYPKDKLTVEGLKCYINGEYFGEFIPLSVSSQYKSVSFPNVNKVIFDEFIIDKGTFRYLPNEVEVFLELFETIARMRDDVRALFLANAISIVNPYFIFFKLKVDPGKRFNVNDHLVVELFKDQDYIHKKKSTRFGQLVSGTKYGDYSIDNNFLRDSEVFIEPKTPKAEFMLSLKYQGQIYGFWVDYKVGLIYANRQYDPSSYRQYTITKEDHEPNLLLIKSLKDCRPMERILYAFKNGLLRFSDQTVKTQCYEIFSFYIR